MRRQDLLEKTIIVTVEGNRKRGRSKMRWIDSIKEARHLNLQELRVCVFMIGHLVGHSFVRS